MKNILSDSIQSFGWENRSVISESEYWRKKVEPILDEIYPSILRKIILTKKISNLSKLFNCNNLCFLPILLTFFFFFTQCFSVIHSNVIIKSSCVPFRDPGHPTMKMCIVPMKDFTFFYPWIFAIWSWLMVTSWHGHLGSKVLLTCLFLKQVILLGMYSAAKKCDRVTR